MNAIITFGSQVLINGAAVDVISWQVQRELRGFSASSVTGATGTIKAHLDKANKVYSGPWEHEHLVNAPVTIILTGTSAWSSNGDLVRTVFVGFVREISVDEQGIATLHLVDKIILLDKLVTLPPVAESYPNDTGTTDIIRRAITPEYAAHRILRECGISVTQTPTNYVILDVPGIGSAAPDIGTLTQFATTKGTPLEYQTANYGKYGGADYVATYRPTTAAFWSWIMAFSFSWQSGPFSIRLGTGLEVRVTRETARTSFEVLVNGVVVVSMPLANIITSQRFAVTYNASSRVITVWNHLKVNFSSAPVSFPEFTTIVVSAGASPGLHGLLFMNTVSDTYLFQALQPRNEITFAVAEPLHAIKAIPVVNNVPAIDVLKEIASARGVHFWFDENGTFQWHEMNALLAQAMYADSIGSQDDIIGISASKNADSGARSCHLTYSDIVLSHTAERYNVTAREFSLERMGANHTQEIDFGPESGEIWGPLDLRLTWVRNRATGAISANAKKNIGTFIEYVSINLTTNAETYFHGTNSLIQLDVENWRLKVQTVAIPSNSIIEVRTPDLAVYGSLKRLNMPVVRADWVAKLTPARVSSTIPTAGNSPAYEHDAGVWVRDTDAKQLCKLIASAVCPTTYRLTLEVVPNRLYTLGMCIRVYDGSFLGFSTTALIVGVDISHSNGSITQILECVTFRKVTPIDVQ